MTTLKALNPPRAGRLLCLLMSIPMLSLFVTAAAYADFYRYTDPNGVEVYTNLPTKGAAVRILREERHTAAPKREPRSEARWPRTSEPEPSAGTVLPVHGAVTSTVGWRRDPIDGVVKHHSGVDIAVPSGTAVKAIAAGRVIESGWRGGYGNLVAIDHGDGTLSMYGHNSTLEVKVGDRVEAGQTVALSGSTGRSTGPHLHFELWKNGSNVTEAFLGSAGIAEAAGGSGARRDGSIVFTSFR